MQPESSQDRREHKQAQASVNNCPNCHAAMPAEMRFCRLCGHRMGEGVAEYTETVRLPHAQAAAQAKAAANNGRQHQAPFEMPYWGPMAAAAPRADMMNAGLYGMRRRRRRSPWLVWPLVAVIGMTMAGGTFIKSIRNMRRAGTTVGVRAPRSYVGVDRLKTVDGGVSFDSISPPDSAADRAGLVGGDLITSFDGHQVKSADELLSLLTQTPIGKTVDVTFIRDGETKTTKMTTVSEEENDRLAAVASSQPKGYLGISDFDRVQVPGQNIYGIQIDVRRNRPADIAGLRKGDIVVEFNGTPIRTEDEFRSRIGRATPGGTVTVVVIRDGQRMEIPVKMGQDD